MTSSTQSKLVDWIAGILQGKQAPTEKLAQIEERQKAVDAALNAQRSKSPQAILEKELSELEAARVALLPQVKAAVIADYQKAEREWEAGEELHRREIAADFLTIQAKLDQWAEHCAQRPRPPAGAPPVYFSNDSEIFGCRNGLVNAGVALSGIFEQGGTGHAPRLAPKRAPQEWGVPLGLAKAK